ncbi:hypothetical protein JTE90_012072 [Oedothorax gibbosus]|uniref:Uncharacterized protein n=1 Tax=Oedothorax gibbosus TaxID=931172 RepID=A0AAV6U6V9_9ARAC|nr:hypothetical protein JTE90_012072 [Oedothorax gibbosus]
MFCGNKVSPCLTGDKDETDEDENDTEDQTGTRSETVGGFWVCYGLGASFGRGFISWTERRQCMDWLVQFGVNHEGEELSFYYVTYIPLRDK